MDYYRRRGAFMSEARRKTINCPQCGSFISEKTKICKKCNYKATDNDFISLTEQTSNNLSSSEISYSTTENRMQSQTNIINLEEIDELSLYKFYNDIIKASFDALNCYKCRSDDYNKLNELIKNAMSVHRSKPDNNILFSPNAPTKPVSATTSAIIGTAIGGTTVGIGAALDANAKKQEYNRKMERYIDESNQYFNQTINNIDFNAKLNSKLYSIVRFISENPKATRQFLEYMTPIVNKAKQEEEEYKRKSEERRAEYVRTQANQQSMASLIGVVIFIIAILLSLMMTFS